MQNYYYICNNVSLFNLSFFLTTSGNIKKLFTAFVLLVFILSNTPKRFLHNVFADHTDKQIPKSDKKSDQLSTFVFNCDDDNQVAEPGFISDQYSQTTDSFTYSNYIVKNNFFTTLTSIFTSLRGPPVVFS